MRQLDDRGERMGLGHCLFAVLLIGLMTAGVLHPAGGDGSFTSSTARALDRIDEIQERVGPRRGITCPAGSVLLRRARTIQKVVDRKPLGTTFCFKSKTYFMSGPIVPKSRDRFVGKYGAVLDGRRWHTSADVGAFTGTGHSVNHVTIRNLAIRNMPQWGIATAYGANSYWKIDYNEISGARIGISFPDYSTVSNNFIHHNSQYGFSGYQTTGSVVQNNEVSHNELCLCHPGDGGASKLFGTTNDSVIGNYIHDNGGNGIWFDTDNTGVLVKGNTVSVNMRDGKAIYMELNNGTAVIRNNRIRVGSRGEVGIFLNNSSNV